MKFLVLLVTVCSVASTCSADRDSVLRNRFQTQKESWAAQLPFQNLDENQQLMFGLLEAASFADLPDEVRNAVPQGGGGVSVSGFSPGGAGADGARARPASPRAPEKIVVFPLVNNKAEAERVLDRVWRDRATGGGQPVGPAGGRARFSPSADGRTGPSVFGTTGNGPDVFASRAGRTLEQEGREVSDLRVRKEYRCLTDEERTKYHAAINALKNTPVGSTNAYDTFAIMHNSVFAPAAHFGPAFLPWHRHFIWMYEQALRQMDETVVLPYYDSSADNRLNNPLQSRIWRPDYLGTAQGPVNEGPFAGWNTPTGDQLRRQVVGDREMLYDENMINDVIAPATYGQMWVDMELQHGSVHAYVSGHMENLTTAAMDPIFYMHHAFVDCLWEEWRENHQYSNNIDPESDYPADSEITVENSINPLNHRGGNRMLPFEVRNTYGLKRVYTQLYYKCQPRNSCPNNMCSYHDPNNCCEDNNEDPEEMNQLIDHIKRRLPRWIRALLERSGKISDSYFDTYLRRMNIPGLNRYRQYLRNGGRRNQGGRNRAGHNRGCPQPTDPTPDPVVSPDPTPRPYTPTPSYPWQPQPRPTRYPWTPRPPMRRTTWRGPSRPRTRPPTRRWPRPGRGNPRWTRRSTLPRRPIF